MKQYISIPQQACLHHGLNLSIIDLAVFDCIKDLFIAPKTKCVIHSERPFYHITHEHFLVLLPILGYNDTKHIVKHLNNLVHEGVLMRYGVDISNVAGLYAAGEYYSKLVISSMNNADAETAKDIAASHRQKRFDLLVKRRVAFVESLQPYVATYGEVLIKEFIDYWCETNVSKTRMRFEIESTWETESRLLRWATNKGFQKKTPPPSPQPETKNDWKETLNL